MNSSKAGPNKSPDKRPNILLRLLGPGLVTGAADDDPSGIATYSQPERNLVMACCGRFS
jgi:Mn2+/Fe2+ NRAMP family transporter